MEGEGNGKKVFLLWELPAFIDVGVSRRTSHCIEDHLLFARDRDTRKSSGDLLPPLQMHTILTQLLVSYPATVSDMETRRWVATLSVCLKKS